MPVEQLPLPLGHLRNSGLLSSHWLENRLPLEPEWKELRDEAQRVLDHLLEHGEVGLAFGFVQHLTKDAPFSPAIQGVISEAVNCIVRIETDRGEIARVDRSQLAPAAQPYQDLIDQLFYAMAGLTPPEASGLEDRLAQML